MGAIKRCLSILFLCIFAAAIFTDDAAPKPIKAKKKAAVKRYEQQQEKKAYRYKEKHDLNNDGTVNAKDRLIWLKNRDGNYQKALVSTENEDIVEVMDIDGDGAVESWEMEGFYNTYDLNRDGTIDQYEMEQVTD